MQPDDALKDAALDQELRRALVVDPSPEFVARVRMRVAEEPSGTPWRTSWVFAMSAVAAVVVVAVALQFVNRRSSPVAETPLLTARSVTPSVGSLPVSDLHVVSAFRPAAVDRSANAFARQRSAKAVAAQPEILIDPHETAALRALISGVRSGRLDLSPVSRASTPTAMDLPPIEPIAIPDLTIEPIAPIGAEGVRQ